MSKVTLKSMTLENYKCFEKRSFDFSERTNVTGKNATGKSTILDAWYDILSGKLADGSEPKTVRPHDKNGKNIDRVPIIRSGTLDVDGKEFVICKSSNQKWTRKRGTTEDVLTNEHITEYSIDGYPAKESAYKDWIAENIGEQNTILMCSNPAPFINTVRKSTPNARALLEKLSGFSFEKFASEHEEYAEVIDIARGNSIEAVLKKLRKDQKSQVEAIEKQLHFIEAEQRREVPTVTAEDTSEWQKKIDAINAELDELEKRSEAVEALRNEYRKADAELANYGRQFEAKVAKELNGLYKERRDAADKASTLNREFVDLQWRIDHNESRIKEANAQIKEYQAKYLAERDSKLDPKSTACPVCGRKYAKDKADKIAAKFEAEKKERLDFITKQGKELQSLRDAAKGAIEEASKELKEKENEFKKAEAELKWIDDRIDGYKDSHKLTDDAEYQHLLAIVTDVNGKYIEAQKDLPSRTALEGKRDTCVREIARIEADARHAEQAVKDKETRIANLNNELGFMRQVAADIERKIDLIMEFSRAKNQALADMVNPHFHHFKFQFLDYTLEGNPVEVCKMVSSGTDYFSGLNHGDRILTEIDLVSGLQEMNGLNLPIFVDDTESLDADRVPNVKQQLILLRRTDGELEVKNADGE